MVYDGEIEPGVLGEITIVALLLPLLRPNTRRSLLD